GFGGVDVFRPEQRAHRNGFVGVLGLLVVQVGSGGGGHDHVVAGTGGGDTPFFPAPGHHGRPRGESSFEDLVPADQTTATRGQVRVELADEPALQFVLVGQPLLLDPFLGGVTVLPLGLGAFVPTHVDVGAGEQLDDFVEDVLVELQDVVGDAEDLVEDPPAGA